MTGVVKHADAWRADVEAREAAERRPEVHTSGYAEVMPWAAELPSDLRAGVSGPVHAVLDTLDQRRDEWAGADAETQIWDALHELRRAVAADDAARRVALLREAVARVMDAVEKVG